MATMVEWSAPASLDAVLGELVDIFRPELDVTDPAALEGLVGLVALGWNLSRLDTIDAIESATRAVETMPEPARWEAARLLARIFVLAAERWPEDDRRVARVRLLPSPAGPRIVTSVLTPV